jgi:hypothetical protein
LFSETDLGRGDVEVELAGEDAVAAEHLRWGGRRRRGGHPPPAGEGEAERARVVLRRSRMVVAVSAVIFAHRAPYSLE